MSKDPIPRSGLIIASRLILLLSSFRKLNTITACKLLFSYSYLVDGHFVSISALLCIPTCSTTFWKESTLESKCCTICVFTKSRQLESTMVAICALVHLTSCIIVVCFLLFLLQINSSLFLFYSLILYHFKGCTHSRFSSQSLLSHVPPFLSLGLCFNLFLSANISGCISDYILLKRGQT